MATCKSKNPRKHLTLEEKLKVIKYREQGYSLVKIAMEFGIGKSTVHDIVKQKQSLREFIAEREREGGCSRKKMRMSDDCALDKAVYFWFIQERSKGTPVSGPLIREKARMLHKVMYQEAPDDAFKASPGWLHRFKQRHGIRQLRLQGESLSADTAEIGPYKKKVSEYIEERQLSLHQIFNTDETGLYWRLLPEKTLAGGHEKTAKNFKKPKDRVTILATANASGDCRLPLLLIGKSAKPRCLKNVDRSALPLLYRSQKKAWMNSSIFMAWFFEQFVPSVKKYLRGKGLSEKAVLFLDNAPTHPSSEVLQTPDGEIQCFFLPANTTSVLQPMDQGVLENLKRRYKRALLEKLLLALDGESPENFVKKLNIKDCIYMSARAWEDIRSESLARSFNKLLGSEAPSAAETDTPEQIDDSPNVTSIGAQVDLSANEVEEWLNCDNNLSEDLTDEEIVQLTVAQTEESDDSDSETEEPSQPVISHKDAISAFSTCLQYLEQQKDTPSVQIMLVNQLMSTAQRKRHSAVKQSRITDFLAQD